ncbi:SUKH-4 family immunity protein [Streptomyces lydicus]|uniref:SUKH-4 family immunity protein n=1 Tax=Streptomyces lydicus TaxID=47763 RepID=UPI00332C81D2
MTEREPTSGEIAPHEVMPLLLRWWDEWHTGDPWAHLADPSGIAGAAVLRELHQQIEGSILVDASGRTAEEVMTEVLHRVGIDVSPANRWNWRADLDRLGEPRLALIVNAHRAGRTRSSSEGRRLVTQVTDRLSGGPVGVLVHTLPEALPPLADAVFSLRDRADGGGSWPTPLRALALSQPREVPMRVWAELTHALGKEPVAEGVLHAVLEDFSDHLMSGTHGVSFADEGLAEELRRSATDDEINRVDRHMTEWLTSVSPEFRHAEGWAAAGPEGRYAAYGLAMHAAQTTLFASGPAEEPGPATPFGALLQDGRVLANIPQTTLMDAARCAFLGDLPGGTAAGDAVHLWSYGVIPSRQPEWAAWLHLMAMARSDRSFAAAVADSGVRLPWKTRWSHWRPPGGYHWRYLEPGPVDGLTAVCWQGRAAVAGLHTWTSRADIWDAVTGEHLAGPWHEEIPEAHHADLTWPQTDEAGAETEAEEDRSGPETVEDLEDAMSDAEALHDTLLAGSPLSRNGQIILGGSGGLFALDIPKDAEFSGFHSPNVEPFSGRYAFTAATVPVDASPPSPADLVQMYGAHRLHTFPAQSLPDGLTLEATRRALIEYGLPDMSDEDGMGIYPRGDHRMSIFDEVTWPSDIDPIEESGPFFHIGFWMGGELVIDGPTGHVLRIPAEPGEEHLAALPAAQSLENFLTMVGQWVTGHLIKELVDGDDEARLLPDYVLAAHKHIDPIGAEAPAWAYAFHSQ